MRFLVLATFLFASVQLLSQKKGMMIQYPAPVFADTNRLPKIRKLLPLVDGLYKEYAARIHSPGLVYGLVADGQLLATGATGYLHTADKRPATRHSAFRIASMSKSVTAMAILQLRDRGKLQLDDPVSKYIPQFGKQAFPAGDAPAVTIRHLLTHAAGFPEDNPWGDRQLAKSTAQLMALLDSGISYANVPGVTYEYSNLGFTLLGVVIQGVSGMPYQQYINQHIFLPLGMTQTYWAYTQVPPEKLTYGYRWIQWQWTEQPLVHDGAWGAMGGLITTVDDFSRYIALHLSAWPPRSDKESIVLKRSSLREMQQPWNFNALNAAYMYPSGRACPTVSAYGYGLRLTKDCSGRVAVGHSGGLPGFGSNWQMLPDYGIAVVCFSNVTYAPTSAINTQVLDTLITLAELKPRKIKASSILVQRQQQLVALLPHWKNAEESGIFAENFYLDNSIDSLSKEAMTWFQKAGRVVRVGEVLPENGLRGSFVLEGEKKNMEVSFTLTPEAVPLIQEYHIREKAR